MNPEKPVTLADAPPSRSVTPPNFAVEANSHAYMQFVSAQGYRIRQGRQCHWIEKRPRLWESAPSHRSIHLESDEATSLFRLGALALRYTCPLDEGAHTYQYIWDDKNFSLESLHKDARRNVRKNFDVCRFKRIGFDLLAREACHINRVVFARQDRDGEDFQTDDSKWQAYMKVCATMPFLEAYGVFIDDRLCAYSLVIFCDDYGYTLHPYAHPEYFKFYPMNVLIYCLVKTVLARPEVRYVSYGVESYTARPTLERFKIAMGCRKAPLGRRITIHPLARPFFSPVGSRIIEGALRVLRPRAAARFSIFARAYRDQGRPASSRIDTEPLRHSDFEERHAL